ncbi:MAG: hypothetical protein COZ06_12455 [Armatimonadetes bacterium CG_4_10_14_3_um_filter_66_18]|nr:MAG: hypothetical protein COS85_12210 [Armatimonadetes bacterium CG07_land_8_20_14_0_80_59_28]PIX41258.1 MAG: hypothetical protein COZ57_23890 [Armatimonadetes bacterium CG_4_8_14_3_um_filter_66_20]PIY49832.1 MAG: hypothetical protein COZ06_12455 [Armatimonadetes bacterium CG_4_10_14_3_um_filter_66_18]PIZ41384.1 MAG: hypothetical protein COY42_19390 [Armatimonadetes bacterium CG_4_10_14_0_8_um_filter_66_14]
MPQATLAPAERRESPTSAERNERVLLFKRRMLEWRNPVEYVNNMYGCHPGDNNTEYFSAVFGT